MRWATRRGCHVDRTACVWLIKRYLDPEAEFYFFGDPTEASEGPDPLAAARLQIVVLYMLLGSVSIAAILVGLLSYRSFFTPRHQLRSAPLEY